MQTINERILILLNDLGMTKTAFAKELGVTQQYVSKLTNVKSVCNPSDLLIEQICLKFNINEKWLKTGEGEKHMENLRDQQLSDFISDIMDNPDYPYRKKLFLALSKFSSQEWQLIEKVIEAVAKDD